MSVYCLYCIFSESKACLPDSHIRGVRGRLVYNLFKNGLGAAVSKLETPPSTKTQNLKVFSDVIAEYHNHQTVIPLRFGWITRDEDQIRSALHNNGKMLCNRLKSLSGCSEMGIRILGQVPPTASKAIFEKKRTKTGKDFLMARKAFYDLTKHVPIEIENKIEMLKKELSETYTEYRFENNGIQMSGPNRGSENRLLVSLFFLVPNTFTEKFCSIYRQFLFEENIRALLSGPWPVFNFVSDIGDLCKL